MKHKYASINEAEFMIKKELTLDRDKTAACCSLISFTSTENKANKAKIAVLPF